MLLTYIRKFFFWGVKISDRTILSDFRGFPQYVQENAVIVPQIKPDLFVTKFIIIHLSTRNDGQFNNLSVPVSGHTVDRY